MFKGEFCLENVKLHHSPVSDFSGSDWFSVPIVIAYRSVLAFYCLVWLVFSGLSSTLGGDTWFIYLTNWTYTCVTTYFLTAATVSITECIKQRRKKGKLLDQTKDENWSDSEVNESEDTSGSSTSDDVMRWYHKALWVLYSIASDMALVVTIAYWTLLYDGYEVQALNVNVHLINSVFMLAETALCSIPIRLLHIVYPFCYGAIYILFTIIYWSQGGINSKGKPYVYSVLDYSKSPGFALVVVLAIPLFVLPSVHLFLYGLFRLRRHLSKKRTESNA